MKITLPLVCFIAVRLICSSSFVGAEVVLPLPPKPVAQGPMRSLEECYTASLHQSEVVASQQELVVQAEERIKQSYGGMLPNINGIASRYWQQSVPSVLYPALQDTVRISATQPLFVGLRDFATLRQSNVLKSAADQDRLNAEIQLYKDTAQAFYTVLSLEKDFDNVQTELKLNDQRVKELRERIRIGRSRISEVLTIQSSEASLAAQGELLIGQINAARDVLAFQTGLPRDIALKDDAPEVPGQVPALDHFLSRLEDRPDIAGDKSRVLASEEGVNIAKGAHLPTLNLNGDYFFVRPGQLSESKWDAQLTLTLPIYAGGATQSQVRTSASLLKQSELTLDRQRRSADQEIRSIYSTVISDQSQMVSLAQATRLSEHNYSEQTREYRLGLVTNIDVLQALTAFQESKRSLDRARFTFKNDYEHLAAAAALKPTQLTTTTN